MDKEEAIDTIFEENFKDNEIKAYQYQGEEDIVSELICIPVNNDKSLGILWQSCYTTTLDFKKKFKNKLDKLTKGDRNGYDLHKVHTKDTFYIKKAYKSYKISPSKYKLVDIIDLLSNNKVIIN
tara:strand:+ start:238 stop:609 length:372 start_codon:yes stop_codon:yes gene_type:complete